MSDSSTYVGPYARLREILSSERARQYTLSLGDYSQGYIEALNKVESIIVEMETKMNGNEEAD